MNPAQHLHTFLGCCVLILGLQLTGCAHYQELHDSSSQIRDIRNSDIQWGGNFAGLRPSIKGASEEILAKPNIDFYQLINALKDENRFIAAHVILTMRTGFEIEKQAGIDPLTGEPSPGFNLGEKFNGLKVDIFADGKTVIAPNQQARLISKWKEWQRTRQKSKL